MGHLEVKGFEINEHSRICLKRFEKRNIWSFFIRNQSDYNCQRVFIYI